MSEQQAGYSAEEITQYWFQYYQSAGYDPSVIYQYLSVDPNYLAAIQAAQQQQQPLPTPAPPAPDHSKDKSSSQVPLSVDSNYNLNAALAKNILHSEYFKNLYSLKTWHEVIQEICKQVTHVEPNVTGHSRIPSTAFCLLYKLFTLKVTYKQLNSMLRSKKSGFVRAIGFLYLRYGCAPKDLWEWFEPFLTDSETFGPDSTGTKITIGEFCRKVLMEQNYYSTIFPRIPVLIQREINKKLLALEGKASVDEETVNENCSESFRRSIKPGTKLRAQYFEDGKYYDAVVDSVLENGKFLVTFSEYGNQEEVDLQALKLASKKGKPSANASDNIPDEVLEKKVIEMERSKATSKGKDYSRRPPSFKTALTTDLNSGSSRKRSRSPSRKVEVVTVFTKEPAPEEKIDTSVNKRRKEITPAQEEKLRKLRERYGDASTNPDIGL